MQQTSKPRFGEAYCVWWIMYLRSALKRYTFYTIMEFEFDPGKSDRNRAKHWSAVITYRSDDIRIISVRRSRDEEVVLYES